MFTPAAIETPPCPTCGRPVDLRRTWRQVNWYCRDCNTPYPLSRFSDQFDDALEALLGNIRCDRM